MFQYLEEGKTLDARVRWWLFVGLFMLVMQITIGGVTRLTGSGLSITKWEIVTGAVPPLSESAWQTEFEHYQQTPQYQKINVGMTLSEFKFIYFWEYLHRLWARWMGLVFLFPFWWFLMRGMLPRSLVRRLGGVIGLAALAASFGWIMVASGLIERPWVNAYKLTLHLAIGFSVFAWLFWATLHALLPETAGRVSNPFFLKWTGRVFLLACLQFLLGGLMSGTKAGLFYPTWPTMHGAVFPEIIFDKTQWSAASFEAYDADVFVPALVQTLHRFTAYLLAALVVWLFMKNREIGGRLYQMGNRVMLFAVLFQVLLGIVTVLNCLGHIPVFWGELHQLGGVFLLTILIFQRFLLRRTGEISS